MDTSKIRYEDVECRFTGDDFNAITILPKHWLMDALDPAWEFRHKATHEPISREDFLEICRREVGQPEPEVFQEATEIYNNPNTVWHETTAYREPKKGRGRQHLIRVGYPHTLNELAKHMDCDLGNSRNWEKGMKLSLFADALERHWTEHLSGNDTDGKALVSAVWNLLGYAETLHRIQAGTLPAELDDIDRGKRSEVVYGTAQ